MPRWLSRFLDHLTDLPPALRERAVIDVRQLDEPPTPRQKRAVNRELDRNGLTRIAQQPPSDPR